MKRSESRRSRALWGSLFVAAFVLVLAPAAQAYVDPGTGSFFFQLLIGGLVGAAVAVKAFWGRIVSFFSRRGKDRGEERSRRPAESVD
jgi:hypothetical protein